MTSVRTDGEAAFRRALRAELVVDAVLGAATAVAVSGAQLGSTAGLVLAVPALLLLAMLVTSLRLMADIRDPTTGDLRLLGGQRVDFAHHRRRAVLGLAYCVSLLVVLGVSGLFWVGRLSTAASSTSLLFNVAWMVAVGLLIGILLWVRSATRSLLGVQASLLAGDLEGAKRRGVRSLRSGGPPQLEAWRRRLQARLAWLDGRANEAERLWTEDWDGGMNERACALIVSRLERGDEAIAETWLHDFDAVGPWFDHLRAVVRARLAIRRRAVSEPTGLLQSPELLTATELREERLVEAAVLHLRGDTTGAQALLAEAGAGLDGPATSEPSLAGVLADARAGRPSGPPPTAAAATSAQRGEASHLLQDPFAAGVTDTQVRRDPSGPWMRGVVPVDFAGAVQRRSAASTIAIVLLVSLLLPLAALLTVGTLFGDGLPRSVASFGLSAGALGLGMVAALALEGWVLWRQSGALVLGDGVQLRDLGPAGWRVWAAARLLVLFVPIGVFIGSAVGLGSGTAVGVGVAWLACVAAVLLGRRAGRYLVLCHVAHTETPEQLVAASEDLGATALGTSVGVRCWRGLGLLFSGRSQEAEAELNSVAQLLPEAGLLASWAQVGRKTVSIEGLVRGGWPTGLGARYRRHVLRVLVAVTQEEPLDTAEALAVADQLPNRWGALLVALCALHAGGEEGPGLLRRRRAAVDALPLVKAAWPHLSEQVNALQAAVVRG